MNEAFVENLTQSVSTPLKVRICDSFFDRLVGFMFSSSVKENEGLLFRGTRESRIDSSVHMFFMNFDLAIFWADRSLRVVDKILARRWKTIAFPASPAQFIIEAHPNRYSEFQKGDQLSIKPF